MEHVTHNKPNRLCRRDEEGGHTLTYTDCRCGKEVTLVFPSHGDPDAVDQVVRILSDCYIREIVGDC